MQEIGRQLNEEADRRREAQERREAESQREPSASPLRRVRLLGRYDANPELVRYAEAWARRIELNTLPDAFGTARQQPHVDPVVNVAVRSDGTVESVTLLRSSGVAALDAAIEPIVRSPAVQLPFPPTLDRLYDVIEIRRSWHFDTAVRLY